MKVCAGHETIDEILVILEAFDRHEDNAEERRRKQQPNESFLLVQFRGADGQSHEQATE